MSHTACKVKLSSTLVYGATNRWKRDTRRRRVKAGSSARCFESFIEESFAWQCKSCYEINRPAAAAVAPLTWLTWIGTEIRVATRAYAYLEPNPLCQLDIFI